MHDKVTHKHKNLTKRIRRTFSYILQALRKDHSKQFVTVHGYKNWAERCKIECCHHLFLKISMKIRTLFVDFKRWFPNQLILWVCLNGGLNETTKNLSISTTFNIWNTNSNRLSGIGKNCERSLAGNQLCKYQSYQDSDACHPETSITS